MTAAHNATPTNAAPAPQILTIDELHQRRANAQRQHQITENLWWSLQQGLIEVGVPGILPRQPAMSMDSVINSTALSLERIKFVTDEAAEVYGYLSKLWGWREQEISELLRAARTHTA